MIREKISLQNQIITNNIRNSLIGEKTINSMNIFEVIVNQDMEIVYCNKSFLKLADNKNILGEKFGKIVSCANELRAAQGCGSSAFCSYCPVFQAISNDQLEEEKLVEGSIGFDSGSSFDLLIKSTCFKIDGQLFTMLLIEDISAKKRKRLLERVFFHDLNNTFTIMEGYLALLKDEIKNNKILEKLSKVYKRLVGEIAFYSQVTSAESNELEVEEKVIEIASFISEIMNSYELIAKQKNINLKLVLSADNIFLKSDTVLLDRIISNLIKNAIEASSSEDMVTVTIEQQDEITLISVANPTYIEKKVQAKIFHKLFSSKGKGRGLGTYSIKLFTEKYLKGSVNFISRKDSGTKFEIKFIS